MNTRKYPRTLQEAFGPYTSQRIDDETPRDTGYGWLWWAVVSLTSVAGVIVIGATA